MSGDSAKPAPSDPFASLGQFKPKDPAAQQAQASVVSEVGKDLDKVAAKNGFHSREPVKPDDVATPKRKRFGDDSAPKVQINIKLPQELKDRYYRMAGERGHSELHKLLEEALDALDEKGTGKAE